MVKSQQEITVLITLGMKHMSETRGPKWLNFFMWLPFFGNMVFLSEGRKAKKLLAGTAVHKKRRKK